LKSPVSYQLKKKLSLVYKYETKNCKNNSTIF
jgi:hypothetical protein